MIGLRPELQFNFRRMKTEQTITNANFTAQTQQGTTFTGKATQKTETDQRLTYVQVVLPFMISPSEGIRVEIGPSFNFLLGGKENTDVTEDYEGTIANQAYEEHNFTTTKKKGSAAVKDFRKMEICAVAGIGYTLDAGLDLDLRYYRGIVTNYDLSEGTSRFRAWTNMVEFSLGWTFGGK